MNAALAEMFRYNRWAMSTLLEACRGLSEDQLDAEMRGASGPVRELLLHLVGGQQTSVLRTKGRQHEGELNRRSTWPGWPALLEAAERSSDELIEIAEGLDADAQVDLPYMGQVFRYPKSFFLVHALEHGVEHRTELKLILAQHGVETPDLDGWQYSAASGYGQRA